MTDKNKKVFDALQKAMRAEMEGHYFYSMAAGACEDPKAKETFRALAEEERMHMEFLRRQYDSILETGKVDPKANMGVKTDLSDESPIFSSAIRSRIGDAHYEMTALAVAIQLERDAETFYRKMANESEDPELAGFYAELADWEAEHYRAFLAQQEGLKEDYWSEAGFAPF